METGVFPTEIKQKKSETDIFLKCLKNATIKKTDRYLIDNLR